MMAARSGRPRTAATDGGPGSAASNYPATAASNSRPGSHPQRRPASDSRGVATRPAPRCEPPGDTHECEPVLGPEAVAVEPALELVLDTGRLHVTAPRRAAEQHVPPRKQHAEVAAVLRALVAVAHRVMPPMKRRADEQPFTQPAEIQADVRVLDALRQIPDRHQH